MRKFTTHKQITDVAKGIDELEVSVLPDTGSDYRKVLFRHAQGRGYIFYQQFNGRFFGKFTPDGKTGAIEFDSNNTQLESEEWFNKLLDLVYVAD